jgi:CRP-like cAMP-binding protein
LLKFFKKLFFDENFKQKKAFLSSMDLFKGLSNREIGLMAQALHSRTYHAGEVLFMEGDIGRALFILESGKVELAKKDAATGENRVIFTVSSGDFFGEMALLEQMPRTATATAAERAKLHLLYRSKLDGLLSQHPRIGISIMSHLAQLLSSRLRRASSTLAAPISG